MSANRTLFNLRGKLTAIIWVPCCILSLFSRAWIPETSALDPLIDLCGWFIFMTGLIFRFWSTLYLGGYKERVLIQNGPFSLCRNPLYFGTILILFSVAIFQASLSLLTAVLLIFLVFNFLIIPTEEKILGSKFGKQFDAYCKTTNRIIPSFKSFHSTESIEIKTYALANEFKRAFLWIWIPPLLETIAHLQTQSWWPFLF